MEALGTVTNNNFIQLFPGLHIFYFHIVLISTLLNTGGLSYCCGSLSVLCSPLWYSVLWTLAALSSQTLSSISSNEKAYWNPLQFIFLYYSLEIQGSKLHNCSAHLVYFLSPRDHSLLSDIQCFKTYVSVYFFPFFVGGGEYSGKDINLVSGTSCLEVETYHNFF